jgi:hypothetical protein
MKKFVALFLGFGPFAALSPVAAQTTTPEVIVVQTYYTGTNKIEVVVASGGEKLEASSFNCFEKKDDRQGAGAAGYQQVFAKLYQQGYALKSTFSPGNGAVSTLVFVKEKTAPK